MDWIVWVIIGAGFVGLLLVKQLGQVKTAAAIDYLKHGARIIDVRSPSEFQSGHLPGALNLPLGQLGELIASQIPNKDQALLLHCHSGGRSAIGKRLLKQQGYTQVHNLGSYGRAERILWESGVKLR